MWRMLSAVPLVLLACTGDELKGVGQPVGEACSEADPCAAAGLCLDGICRARCATTPECASEAFECANGGCVPLPVKCGDGLKVPGEACDDHNEVDGDGCSATCTIEPVAEWVAGAWGACSATCGEGSSTRSVSCLLDGAAVDEARCKEPKPEAAQVCRETSGCPCAQVACPGSCVLDTPGRISPAVPAGCAHVAIEAWGGGGSGGSQVGASGGGGAFASGTIALESGAILSVGVAEGGTGPGDGGGASLVWRGELLVLVAAGGGGGGSDGCSGCSAGGAGGAGGAAEGEAGAALVGAIAPYCVNASGGLGGTQIAGGAGGTQSGTASFRCDGGAGEALAGGSSDGSSGSETCGSTRATGWQSGGGQGNGGGGGGGSGWFGGGGAGFIWTYCAGGGGGGSSHADPSVGSAVLEGGHQRTPARAAEGLGAGSGGEKDALGRAGRVVLHFTP